MKRILATALAVGCFAAGAFAAETGGVRLAAGEPFNQALTRIWIGDKPVQGNLKKAMLGG